MSWAIYHSSCGCLASPPEPQLENYELRTSTDPDVLTYQSDHRKWTAAWVAALKEHKQETGHNCIG